MKLRLRHEFIRLSGAARRLDAQTVGVLTLYVVFVIVQFKLGSRRFFATHVGEGELLTWAWWFTMQGITGFVAPVIVLRVFFDRRLKKIGLGAGDWRFAIYVLLLYLPAVVIGTWILSNDAAFQAGYPHYRGATRSWVLFATYHALFLFYWIGWEYLWRGFMLFGTAHTLGIYAIFIQAIPFALLHLQKPVPELLLSIIGGVALGAVVWRCRSFWVAVPLHALQMLFLDLWCTIRVQTGVSGIGPGSLLELLRSAL